MSVKPATGRSGSRRKAASVAAAARRQDIVSWLSDSTDGGLAVLLDGDVIFQNPRFQILVPNADPAASAVDASFTEASLPPATLAQLCADAGGLAGRPIGSRHVRRYQSRDAAGLPLTYEGRFVVVPAGGRQAVLVVLEDVTRQEHTAAEAVAVGRFQSVLARIASLAVSGVGVQEVMNEAARLTAEALQVELCKILIPRESDAHLYLVAGVGWRDGLIGSLTVEGGTHSQAGYAIRERRPVIVRDMRTETRFTPSKLLSDHGGISGMSVPMMVQDQVYGVMGAHSKRIRDFTDKELQFLCSAANAIATVLERWRRDETRLQLYHRLFELVQDGIVLMDAEGRLLEWNPAMERITGWTREDVIGDGGRAHVHPSTLDERLWKVLTAARPFADRLMHRRKDGTECLVWASMSPVKDPDGTIRHYLAIVTDLTEREVMLEALRHAEQVKLVGQLAGGILHEVRNPLIGIGGLALHIAEQETVPAAVRDKCRLIAQEASRIDDILESHLAQLPPRQIEFRPCDLPALLEDTLALLRTKLTAARISVVQQIEPGLPLIETSRAHLQQVWLNVVMNAVEAMGEGGRLTITMVAQARNRPGVLTTIADTGPGITADVLARIYEPFFTSGKAKGVGLGITLSRDLVERSGGQFAIMSPPGSGAVVEIWLPVTQGAGNHPGREAT
ncbi:PAS domain S-box protein [Candidatus Nitrospira bockiana]